MKIYTDGGCWPNPGLGAWAVVMIDKDDLIYKESNFDGFNSTNNICEIKAILKALNIAKEINNKVEIFSDSQYAINSITRWALTWKNNGWMKKHGEIKNIELIKEAHELYISISNKVKVTWVKGHNGNKWNELADELCEQERIKNTEAVK